MPSSNAKGVELVVRLRHSLMAIQPEKQIATTGSILEHYSRIMYPTKHLVGEESSGMTGTTGFAQAIGFYIQYTRTWPL